MNIYGMDIQAIYIPLMISIFGFIVVLYLIRNVLKHDEGSDEVKNISSAIREGAIAFLHTEYKILITFVVIITIILCIINRYQAISFVFGAICSMFAGYVGMSIATRTNGRTATAAQNSLHNALKISFRSGSVMGLTVVSIGVFGLCILYILFYKSSDFYSIIPAYGFGASSVALFARVGGGIYTKGADAAADLVGKIEEGIPEDDPRNAAVIADFVGDNVGDVAGMGADLFESYVDAIIATITLSMLAYTIGMKSILVENLHTAWLLPLMIASAGILASIIGISVVRIGKTANMRSLLMALRIGMLTASILISIFAYTLVVLSKSSINIFWSVLIGLIAGIIIGESTNYFTSYAYSPTKKIAESSKTGAGTNIIAGFSNGLISTVIPFLTISFAIIAAYKLASFYGIAIAGVGMLSTLGISLATDAYGPIADNAGGIVEMVGMSEDVRARTDALDALGNTTAATGKGFAIGAAGLTALALMLSYAMAVGIANFDGNTILISGDAFRTSVLSPHVISGLIVGIMLPAIFCALTLRAVGENTFVIVEEVRRQFREIDGIMEGKVKPDYHKCVELSTKGAIRKMVLPAILTIVSPILVGYIFGKYALGGFLIGAIGSGFMLAVTMANAGASWDNAKKWIESGKLGGKGSETHKSSVVGDTVGDPMKDTAGPSLNIMIKLMSIISLVFATMISEWYGIL